MLFKREYIEYGRKKLTADQLARIEKVKQEAIKEVEKIPEGPRRNGLLKEVGN